MMNCNFPDEKWFQAEVREVKTTAPYPFKTGCGTTWKCKIVLKWWELEEDGEEEEYRYIAYPIEGSTCFNKDGERIPCCSLKPGTWVTAYVESKNRYPNKGQVQRIKELAIR